MPHMRSEQQRKKLPVTAASSVFPGVCASLVAFSASGLKRPFVFENRVWMDRVVVVHKL